MKTCESSKDNIMIFVAPLAVVVEYFIVTKAVVSKGKFVMEDAFAAHERPLR